MLLSAVSVLVVAQSSSEIPEGLMNNSVLSERLWTDDQSSIPILDVGHVSLLLCSKWCCVRIKLCIKGTF